MGLKLEDLKRKKVKRMPRLGKRSKTRLEGVDERLVHLLTEVCKYFDITVIEGKRSQERQNELVAQGKSKTKFGKHVLGMAVDIAPYDPTVKGKIDWNARDDFHYMGGWVMAMANKLGYKIRWGGDWNASSMFKGQRTTKDNSFDDLVHFELLD
jgi:peptidoglycan L-alanyl-D-glutamate endopeptidase CwlK